MNQIYTKKELVRATNWILRKHLFNDFHAWRKEQGYFTDDEMPIAIVAYYNYRKEVA